MTLESILGCPSQHLEFPLWYLKQRGWVERLDSGLLAITADGVDKLGSEDLALPANRMLMDGSQAGHRGPSDADRQISGDSANGEGIAATADLRMPSV